MSAALCPAMLAGKAIPSPAELFRLATIHTLAALIFSDAMFCKKGDDICIRKCILRTWRCILTSENTCL